MNQKIHESYCCIESYSPFYKKIEEALREHGGWMVSCCVEFGEHEATFGFTDKKECDAFREKKSQIFNRYLEDRDRRSREYEGLPQEEKDRRARDWLDWIKIQRSKLRRKEKCEN